jgi:C1A family cysteine protease
MWQSLMRSLSLLTVIALFLILSQESQAKLHTKVVKVFQVEKDIQTQSQKLPFLSLETDPLASVAPLLGHSSSSHSFAMPLVEGSNTQAKSQPATSALQANYEVNRPTRILPDEEHLKSCTITIATKSFANRCVV